MRTLALLAVLVAACVAGWLVLAARDAGPSGRGRARGASAEDSSAAPRGDVSAPLEAAAGPPDGAPLAVERDDAPSPPPRAALAPGDEVAPAGAELPPTSRGRLVDARTLEPIPDALVVTGRQNATTDAEGRFDTGVALDGLADVLVLNVAPGGRKHAVARERWTRFVAGWRVPIEIGPTYRLRLAGETLDPAIGFSARLVNGDEGAPWHALVPRGEGRLPYLRFDEPLRARDGVVARVEVRSVDGLVEGVSLGVPLEGAHELEVWCVPRTVVRGRVLDELGRPLDGVVVWALQLSESGAERLSAQTTTDGSYQFQPSAPGRMRLLFSAQGEPALRRVELEVPSGLTKAPDVVFARGERVAIRGRLQSSAPFPLARIRLRALHGDGYEEETSGTMNGTFAFENLSPGRYELSLRTAGETWTPARLEVVAPAEGILFTREERASAAYRFDVVDARSGAPLEQVRVVVRTEDGAEHVDVLSKDDPVSLRAGARFTWRLTAGGRLPREGDERAFRPDGGARFVARVELASGFGARVVVAPWSASLLAQRHDPHGRGSPRGYSFRGGERLAGAAILADGVQVATTDERGVADVQLESAPRRLEARLPGWRALGESWPPRGTLPNATEVELFLVPE